MEKIRRICQTAKMDGTSRKKKNRIVSAFLVSTLLIFFIVNVMMQSVKKSVEDIVNQPYGSMCYLLVEENDGESWEEMEHQVRTVPGVSNTFFHIMSTQAEWMDADCVGAASVSINLLTKTGQLGEYVTKGSADLQEGEILLPKYIYGLGNYDSRHYLNGESLVGEKISIRIESLYDENFEKNYTFIVRGTYDNVSAMCSGDMFCVSEEDAKQIYADRHEGQEEYLRGIMEDYGLEGEQEYEEMLQPLYMGVEIDRHQNREEVKKNLEEVTGGESFDFMVVDQNLIDYFEFVILIGNVMVFLLAVATLISFSVVLREDIRERKKEFAVRAAMGYRSGEQTAAYMFEKTGMCLKAWLISVLAFGLLLIFGNILIQSSLPFYLRNIVLKPDMVGFAATMAGVLVMAFLCMIPLGMEIRKIRIADELKREGNAG